jgi:site-specific recombinase XerD
LESRRLARIIWEGAKRVEGEPSQTRGLSAMRSLYKYLYRTSSAPNNALRAGGGVGDKRC